MSYNNIIVEFEGKVGIIKFNAPKVLNALSPEMTSELGSAINDVLKSDARCLLLTAEGRAFCAGANLQGGSVDGPSAPGHVLETHFNPIMNRLRKMEIPFVTAINGPAVGVGMSFAIMSDYAVAAKSAYFLQAFANIGLIPDGGATYILPRIVGWRRAVELSMLAERLPAETALEWGLINKVVDDEALQAEGLAMATRLANGPRSLGLIRQAYWASLDNSFSDQVQLESDLQTIAGRSKDNAEGIRAFLEKRPAQFTGE